MTLPTDSAARKAMPMAQGCLDYFPDALAEVARVSKLGSDKHNPGEPIHWSREKSSDHADCILRHMVDRGKVDPETGILHDAQVAWRALAQLQLALERQAQKREVLAEDAKIWVEWSEPATRTVEINTSARDSAFVDVTASTAASPPVYRCDLCFGPGATRGTSSQLTLCDKCLQKRTDRLAQAIVETGHIPPVPAKPPVTLWYLATPYINYPAGHDAAARMADTYAARLMKLGIPVFCPISHSHPIAAQLPPGFKTDHEFWMRVDKPLMDAASGLIVVTEPSWELSRGMKVEIETFRRLGKPVVFWHPAASLPAQFNYDGTYRG